MRLFPLIALIAACEKGEDTGVPIPSTGSDDTEATCGGEPPEALSLAMSDGEFRTYGDDPTEYMTAFLTVEATDADGDLDEWVLDFWWDTEIDGAVDTSGSPDAAGLAGALDDDHCSAGGATLIGVVFVGLNMDENTVYDVAATVTDAAGLTSNVVTTTGTTPYSDGSPGDAN